MALAPTDMALVTTDLRTSASRSRAERAGDGVIAGYLRSLTRTTRPPYNLADGPEPPNQAARYSGQASRLKFRREQVQEPLRSSSRFDRLVRGALLWSVPLFRQ